MSPPPACAEQSHMSRQWRTPPPGRRRSACRGGPGGGDSCSANTRCATVTPPRTAFGSPTLPLPKPRIRGFRPLNKVIEIGNNRFRLGGWANTIAVRRAGRAREGARAPARSKWPGPLSPNRLVWGARDRSWSSSTVTRTPGCHPGCSHSRRRHNGRPCRQSFRISDYIPTHPQSISDRVRTVPSTQLPLDDSHRL